MMPAELQHQIDQITADYMKGCRWVEYSKNRLTREGAQIYVQQHGHMTRHSRRAWAYVVGQCPVTEVRRFIVKENLWEEEGIEEQSHYLKLVKMGVAVGLSKADVDDAKALPTTRAALLIWEHLTKDRHWLVGCAAKAVMEHVSQPQCGEFNAVQGKLWMHKLGLSRDAVDFWLLHDELDREHGGGAFDLIGKYLDSGPDVGEHDVLTAVEDSILAFRMFFDGIADAADATAGRKAA